MAYKFSSRKDLAIYGLPAEDVKFSFELPDELPIGKDVKVALKMKNTTYQTRTVDGKMTGMIGFYTGIPCKDLKEENFEMVVEPRQGQRRCFLNRIFQFNILERGPFYVWLRKTQDISHESL